MDEKKYILSDDFGRLGRGKKVTVMDALSEDPDLSVYVVIFQKSIPAQIRQLIL